MPYKDPKAQKEAQCRHYEANRDQYLARNERNREKKRICERARRVRNYTVINEFKNRPCMDCGGTFPPFVMDLDHCGDDKELEVSKMASQGFSLARIKAEMAKCEVVCANCHRERTHQRRMLLAES